MSAKEDLNKLITDIKLRKFQKEAGDNVVKEATGQIINAVLPALKETLSSVGRSVENAMEGVRFTPQINVSSPDVHVPNIEVPTPIVNYTPPAINIPDIKMPDEMNIKGWVNFLGYDKGLLTNPLPVQIRDASGNPVSLGGSGGVIGSGGKADYLTIKAYSQSAFSELMNPDGRVRVETGATSITDTINVNQVSGANWSVEVTNADLDIRDLLNASDSVSAYQVSGHIYSVNSFLDTTASLYNSDNRLRVSVETGGSGLTDAELRASSVPVEQVSGSIWSVYAQDALTTVSATTLVNADNRLRVSVETGGSGLTDAELRATAVPVSQLSGAIWSTEVKGTVTVDGSGVTQPVSATDLDIRDLVNATDSVRVYQLSGAEWSVVVNSGTITAVTSITNSVATALIDSSGVQYSTSNPVPVDDAGGSLTIDGTVTVSDITASVKATIIDSSGVGYSGSNPVPVDLATSLDHTIDSISVRQVSGSNNSSQVKLIARQTNPTAASDAAEVFASADDLGRTLVRPIQVRDLIATAYISLTNGTETTVLAGASSTFHDLIYVMCANQSDAATFVDFRCGTAGSVIMTVQVPASGTAGISLPVPHKMPEVAQAWTADLPDITGTTVDITAQFSQEI